ncbi:hypothetical protein SDC9_172514 [bioreactor metagenome]|uniref:Uncharacterized protein n=1 Tax=bioreactor metagenome TaxID=1076179 RepID=A0A645GDX4_9ZZZZ
MSCSGGCKFSACSCLGVVISIIFGAVIGVLFAFDLIPFITTALWIVFGLGVLALIFLLIAVLVGAATGSPALSKCLCSNALCLLVGTIGTIVSSVIALSFVLEATSIFAAAIVAIVAFFLAFMLIGLIAMIACIASELCCHA